MDRSEMVTSNILTVQEVSRYLRVHPSTIYRLLKKSLIPAFKVGSDWRFSVEAINRWRSEAESEALRHSFSAPHEEPLHGARQGSAH
jgi:excisionase family DNA binding protein